MKDLFVPYEIALKLKELGFNEPCFGYYCKHRNTVVIPDQETLDKLEAFLDIFPVTSQNHFRYQSCLAPLYQQVIDWFREKHNIIINSVPIYIHHAIGLVKLDCYIPHCFGDFLEEEYDTYYKAFDAAIEKAINLIKNK